MNSSENQSEENSVDNLEVIKENVTDMHLNLARIYKKLVDHCDRDLFRVHEPKVYKDDKGSKKDENLVYIELKAGLFVAMRTVMMKYLIQDFNAKVTKSPKIQTSGCDDKEAETRV